MAGIEKLTGLELEPEQEFSQRLARTLFVSNPAGVKSLVYGDRVPFAALPHDHGAQGGEAALYPIVAHSFGMYGPSFAAPAEGIPLAAPFGPQSFAPSFGGDYSKSKRLASFLVVIPGGITRLRVTLCLSQDATGHDVKISAALRPLSSINFRLSDGPFDVISDLDFSGTVIGAEDVSAEISGFGVLGDATEDRESEFSLWLSSDLDPGYTQRILSVLVVPLPEEQAAARSARPTDAAAPEISTREIRSGVGVISPSFVRKVSTAHNGLARGLWGRAPGLRADDTFDTRQGLQSVVRDAHRHQGALFSGLGGELVSDGACIKEMHAACLIGSMIENPASGLFTGRPSVGVQIHPDVTLATGWLDYRARLSVPAGLGALLVRVSLMPVDFDPQMRLFAQVTLSPIAGGESVITSLSCGPFVDPEGKEVEVYPEDDPAFVRNGARLRGGLTLWGADARFGPSVLESRHLDANPLRVSLPIRAVLTNRAANPADPPRETGDFLFSLRLVLNKGDLTPTPNGTLHAVTISTESGW